MIVRSRDDVRANVIALTFDDGPGDWTPALLDLLRANGARATFFVLGESIAGREDVLRRAAAEDHELGNHTWSHRRASTLSDGDLREELQRTGARVAEVVGATPKLARPPYGEDAERFARVAAGLGLGPTVLWSVDPEDWREPPAAEIVAATLAGARPGAIVDLHDGFRRGSSSQTRQSTVDAVAELLPALDVRAFRCVTVSELLAAR